MIMVMALFMAFAAGILGFLIGRESKRKKLSLEANAFANIHVMVSMALMDKKINEELGSKIKTQSELGAKYLQMAVREHNNDKEVMPWHEFITGRK